MDSLTLGQAQLANKVVRRMLMPTRGAKLTAAEVETNIASAKGAAARALAEGDAELWDLRRVLGADEIRRIARPCMTPGCGLAACSVWSSNLAPDEPWLSCLDCQHRDFGGWPARGEDVPLAALTPGLRETLRARCTRFADPLMPAVPSTLAAGAEVAEESDKSGAAVDNDLSQFDDTSDAESQAQSHKVDTLDAATVAQTSKEARTVTPLTMAKTREAVENNLAQIGKAEAPLVSGNNLSSSLATIDSPPSVSDHANQAKRLFDREEFEMPAPKKKKKGHGVLAKASSRTDLRDGGTFPPTFLSESEIALKPSGALEHGSSLESEATETGGNRINDSDKSNGRDASKTNRKTPHAQKGPSNPLIGATVRITAGEFKGLSGKVTSTVKGWWAVDNPNMNGKHVRSKLCDIVENGTPDVHAESHQKSGSSWRFKCVGPQESSKKLHTQVKTTLCDAMKPSHYPRASEMLSEKSSELNCESLEPCASHGAKPMIESPKETRPGFVLPVRWRCDICKARCFDTYEEASEHEQKCTGVALRPSMDNTLSKTAVKGRTFNPEATGRQFGGAGASPLGFKKTLDFRPESSMATKTVKQPKDSDPGPLVHPSQDNKTPPLTETAAKTALRSLLAADTGSFSSPFKELILKIQQICSVQCPEGYDEAVFYDLPVEMQKELSKSNQTNIHKDMNQSLNKSKRYRGEKGRISDHLKSGMHYHAPAVEGGRVPPGTARERLAKRSKSNEYVVTRRLDDRQGISSRPTHYCPVPGDVFAIANELASELLQRFSGNGEAKTRRQKRLGRSCEQVDPGYYKGHLHDDTSLHLQSLNFLPSHFQIKESAAQKSILFLNTKDWQCTCHFDRDSSLLYLVSGQKQVKISPPLLSSVSSWPGDGILHGLDPFSSNKSMHGGIQWETIAMTPGSVSKNCVKYFLVPSYPRRQSSLSSLCLSLSIGCIASEALVNQTTPLPFPSKSSLMKKTALHFGNQRSE